MLYIVSRTFFMKIHLISVSQKPPRWVVEGFDDYIKRLPPHLQPILHDIPAKKRGKNAVIAKLMQQEEQAILAAIPKHSRVIALAVQGQAWDTPQLSAQLASWQQESRDIYLIIGGPEGLTANLLKRADTLWSLSKLTFPHTLVRVLLAEQLYRAYSLLQGHPYHRE